MRASGVVLGKRLCLSLLVAVLVETPPATQAGTAGHLLLYVRGNVSDIVLVDPAGRADRQTDSIAVANIPGCGRWPGGLGGDQSDPTTVDSSARSQMLFELSIVHYGRYLVSAQSDDSLDVEVVGTFDTADHSSTACVDLTRRDRVAVGRTTWAVDVRRSPPPGECTIRITRLGEWKSKGRCR